MAAAHRIDVMAAVARPVLGVLRQGRLLTTEVEYEQWPNMRIAARLEMSFT